MFLPAAITIGGVDVRDMAENDLMRHVSFVFQDIFLFKQSILDNIRMGNPTASEEQVIAAAKAAQCHDFISKLPDGYHTVVGSEGHPSLWWRASANCHCAGHYQGLAYHRA